ncbi:MULTISPECIES: OsmC family protein [Bacillaceae]|uniref:Peroxiredoxin n=1 Tax=Gottfriedia luciferensis TaxID=178774 RepID=A0ABX2ZME6_9BACI|nr:MULTISPECIES: OsmC family protein [Bacillaceae]ODG90878.1 peroxiredoxin [Gottfriedia luciferensis]PGZ90722.1 peroxiredoxin [Bacillus sp. AFS029533]SFD30896.1 putative redox protein [Bacillus sp. UNCCL81]
MKTSIKWDGKLAFSGIAPSGHEIKMDTAESLGGDNSAPTPVELLINAVAGCTAIDIVLILEKMRLKLTSFEIEVNGERAEEHPKRFTDIHLHYILGGELDAEKVRKAIKLSKDKYCSVAHSLNANITASFTLNGTKDEEVL